MVVWAKNQNGEDVVGKQNGEMEKEKWKEQFSYWRKFEKLNFTAEFSSGVSNWEFILSCLCCRSDIVSCGSSTLTDEDITGREGVFGWVEFSEGIATRERISTWATFISQTECEMGSNGMLGYGYCFGTATFFLHAVSGLWQKVTPGVPDRHVCRANRNSAQMEDHMHPADHSAHPGRVWPGSWPAAGCCIPGCQRRTCYRSGCAGTPICGPSTRLSRTWRRSSAQRDTVCSVSA